MKTLLTLFLFLTLFAEGQDDLEYRPIPGWDQLTSKQQLEQLRFTTSAYRNQALQMILEEANKVAKELHLLEKLPITKTNLTAISIATPRYCQMYGALGNISTTNYTYYVSVDNKLSSVVRTHGDNELLQLLEKYRWPMWRVQTNAAYQLATQFLAQASVDVAKLNQNCKCVVYYPDEDGKFFTPNYSVVWTKGEVTGNHAKVEIFMPKKLLRDLSVNRSEYILRKPLEITNLVYLLSQTNAVAGTDAPASQ